MKFLKRFLLGMLAALSMSAPAFAGYDGPFIGTVDHIDVTGESILIVVASDTPGFPITNACPGGQPWITVKNTDVQYAGILAIAQLAKTIKARVLFYGENVSPFPTCRPIFFQIMKAS